jgi:hypothetical protein
MEFSKPFREPFRKRIDSLELGHQHRARARAGAAAKKKRE